MTNDKKCVKFGNVMFAFVFFLDSYYNKWTELVLMTGVPFRLERHCFYKKSVCM